MTTVETLKALVEQLEVLRQQSAERSSRMLLDGQMDAYSMYDGEEYAYKYAAACVASKLAFARLDEQLKG